MSDARDISGNTPAPRDSWEHDGIAHAFDHVCRERDALRAEVSELRADLIRTGAIADREQERGIVLKRQRDEWRDQAEILLHALDHLWINDNGARFELTTSYPELVKELARRYREHSDVE